MARYRESVCRLCRREGMKLFLKGDRCFKDSCAIEKRNFAPGQHGKDRKSKVIGYGLQLREKQKVKRIYGLLEGQFRNYFEKAERRKGVTGDTLLQMLERRLDNIVYRLGFATSRAQSRQLIGHGHVRVNSLKVNIPSFQVKAGDVISIREKSQKNPLIVNSVEMVGSRGIPSWLELDGSKFSGKVLTLPKREDINLPVQERLIVELYSK
ncbi:MAG: 30S ribosomal protein S4 [Acidobacteria bacterium]|nr:MAG: 30S ribosomal protein S4 [Acidobacteriota bacterium]